MNDSQLNNFLERSYWEFDRARSEKSYSERDVFKCVLRRIIKTSFEFERFLSWIQNDINPIRIKNGNKTISDSEAEECWTIMKEFEVQFNKEAT